jgi:hypothetical protein
MRKLALLAVVSATAALTAAGPKPKATFLFSLKDQRARHWVLSADLRRVYYFEDPTQLYVLDRTTGKSSKVLGPMVGLKAAGPVSQPGIAWPSFGAPRAGENRSSGRCRLIPRLDCRTRHRDAWARAVAGDVTFSPDGKWIAIAVGTPTGPITETRRGPDKRGPEHVVAEVQETSRRLCGRSPPLYFGPSDEKENRSKNGFIAGVSGGKPQFVLERQRGVLIWACRLTAGSSFAFDTTDWFRRRQRENGWMYCLVRVRCTRAGRRTERGRLPTPDDPCRSRRRSLERTRTRHRDRRTFRSGLVA